MNFSKFEVRAAFLFALFGALWVFATDWLLLWLVPSLPQFGQWQTVKGWVYVAGSTAVVYLLLATARRRQQTAAAAQAKSEARYRLLFDHNPLSMWVYDLETLRVLAVNDTAVAAYGYTRDEFLQLTLRDLRPPEDVARLLADVAQTQDRLNFAGTWRHRRKDGTVFPVEIVSHALTYEGRPARLVVAYDISKQKEAEVALQESERQFRKAIEEAPFPAIIHAEDGAILALSRSWTEITGYDPAEIPTVDAWTERAYGERQQAVQAGIDRLYELDRRVDEGEFEVRCKDGSRRVWAFSTTPLGPLPDGRRTVISLAVDVTERKAAEQALRLRSAALEAAANAVVITDVAGTIKWANPAFTTLTGYTRAEAVGKNPRELVKSGIHDRAFYAKMWQTILGGDVWRGEIINRRKNGKLYTEEAAITPVHRENGEITHFIAIKQDITARKEVEAERERLLAQVQVQAEQLAQIMVSVPEGVCLLNSEGMVLTANPQAKALLALLADAGVGDRLERLGERPLATLLTSPPRGKWHTVVKNDRAFRVLARSLESGPVAQGWVLVIRDVTEQQMVQQQLQRQERLAAIGQLAAGIAHDFNNIMAVISLYAQLMQKSPAIAGKDQERLGTIYSQANRAAQLVQQILDFSRQSVLEKRPLDLLPLLKEEIKLLQRTLPEHIEIKLRYDEADYFVQADPTRMQQVIMNLALNARDAMPSGGKLQLRLHQITVENEKHAPLPQMEAGPWIRLTVTDTGRGIDPAVLDHVFEPFFTTKQPGQGTGLGLAQVHGIVGQHGGHITIDSKVGAGTTLTLYLPALQVETAVPPTDVALSVPHGQGKVVLVVEDDDVLREAMKESMKGWHYRVLAAANGEEALDVLRMQSTAIDLIVSDVVMPRLGGTGLLRAVRRQGWQIPVILLTGHPLDEQSSDPQDHDVFATLAKPIDLARLAQVMADALENDE